MQIFIISRTESVITEASIKESLYKAVLIKFSASFMENEITIQNIDKLLAFLPLFERREELYELRFDIDPTAPYVYANEVIDFIETLGNEGFLVPFDWPTWRQEARRLVSHPESLNLATLDMLQKLLTTHVRFWAVL